MASSLIDLLNGYASTNGYNPSTLISDFLDSDENEQAEFMAQIGGEVPQADAQGQMQEIMMQVAQALQQGANPEEVMQSLMEMGVEHEQAAQMIQGVMQQLQGAEQPIMQRGGEPIDPLGYYNNNPQEVDSLIVPTKSGRITMKDNPYTGETLPPINAYDANTDEYFGMMQPGEEYQFPTDMIREEPVYAQTGLSELTALIEKEQEKINNQKKEIAKQADSYKKRQALEKIASTQFQFNKDLELIKRGRINTGLDVGGGDAFIPLNSEERIQAAKAMLKKYGNSSVNKVVTSKPAITSDDKPDARATINGKPTDLFQINKNNASNEYMTKSGQQYAYDNNTRKFTPITKRVNNTTNTSNTEAPKGNQGNTQRKLGSKTDYQILVPPKLGEFLEPVGLRNTTEFQMQAIDMKRSNPALYKAKVDEAIKKGWAKDEAEVIRNLQDGKLGRITKLFIPTDTDAPAKTEEQFLKSRQTPFTQGILDGKPLATNYNENTVPNVLNSDGTLKGITSTQGQIAQEDKEIPSYLLNNNDRFANILMNGKLANAHQPIRLPYRADVTEYASDMPLIDPDPVISPLLEQYRDMTKNIGSSTSDVAFKSGIANSINKAIETTVNDVAAKNQQIAGINQQRRLGTITANQKFRAQSDMQYLDDLNRTEANADMMKNQAYNDALELKERANTRNAMYQNILLSNPNLVDGTSLLDKFAGNFRIQQDPDYFKLSARERLMIDKELEDKKKIKASKTV